VLVVANDAVRPRLASLLERHGCRVFTARDGARGCSLLDSGLEVDAVVLDLDLPGIGGLESLRRIRELRPLLAVIVVAGSETLPTVKEAARLGAVDFVIRPFSRGCLEAAVDAALALSSRSLHPPPAVLPKPQLWRGPTMSALRDELRRVASSDAAVVIQGETGVGKEMIARAIHDASPRARGPFVRVHCAALPRRLIESELFGCEKGAFTDACARRRGKFEQAHGGTIFLDEVFEIELAAQPKLLHVLESGEVQPLGSNTPVPIDVRVVCATHQPLEQRVRENRFRADLFYRLAAVQIHVPPLRERRAEIAPLFDLFLRHYALRYGRPVPAVGRRLRRFLQHARFPGNVRELENLARRAVVLDAARMPLHDWAPADLSATQRCVESAGTIPLLEVRRRVAEEVERAVIEHVLAETGWDRRETAHRLGVSCATLHHKIVALGLGCEDAAAPPPGAPAASTTERGRRGPRSPDRS